MTDRERLEIVRSDMHRIEAMLSALLSELDLTWNAMKETRTELGKITKDVATLRSLWPRNILEPVKRLPLRRTRR